MRFLLKNFVYDIVNDAGVFHEHGFFLHDKNAKITHINQLIFNID
jgi:hypothetical protein